jgi:uncharacterized membrane protein YoaK (UPF0700 family)
VFLGAAVCVCLCGWVGSLCLLCVVWALVPLFYLLNIMMRSSPAFSRKKNNEQ